MEKVLQSIFILVCCCSDIFAVVNYLIELHDLPNCFLDVDVVSNKIIYNCYGGLKFSLVNGNPGVLFQSATGNEQYICHQGFVPYLLPLGGNEHTFYIVNNNDNYAMVRSKDYPTRYLWQNDLTFVFEENKETTTKTKYKFIVCDFTIGKIDSISRYSLNVIIDESSPILSIPGLIIVIKCESLNNEVKLFNVTDGLALVTSLHSHIVYNFSAGFQNEYGSYVFGNVTSYETDEDLINYYIEIVNYPNCFLDVDTSDLKIVYNCSGGSEFSLVNGEKETILIQSATEYDSYICHQGFVPYLLPLGGNEHTFYMVANKDSYVTLRSNDYPTRYLWFNGLVFMFEEEVNSTFKLTLSHFSIERIDRKSRYSADVIIDKSSPILNMSGLGFVIKCESSNKEIKLFNVTGGSALITDLNSNTSYAFSAGFQNEYGIFVFGMVSFYHTEEDDINANCGINNNFTDLSGVIRFPAIGSHYSNDVECRWVIDVDPYTLILNINNIDMECGFDYVIFYDDSSYQNEIGSYCTNNSVVRHGSGVVYIKVVTDYINYQSGFTLTWNSTIRVVNYLIEPLDLPNCFLDVDIDSNKIIYSCNGGLRFLLVNENLGVLFQSATDNTKYICHQGYVPYLLPLGGNDHTFDIVNKNNSYVMVTSVNYPTRYLWRNGLTFLFEENKETTRETIYKFIVCDFNIKKIDRTSRYSVNVIIDKSSPILYMPDLDFLIKCENANNEIKLFNVSGSSTPVTALHSNTSYMFSAGFQNEYGIFVFGSVSYYHTEEDDTIANCGINNNFTDLSGVIRFPAIGSHYSNDVECRWVINVAPYTLKVNINNIDMECGFDYVVIYDDSSYQNEIGAYCTNNYSVMRESGLLYIKVATDYVNYQSGFNLTWSSTISDFNIERIDYISRYSVNVIINESSPILKMSGLSFIVKSESSNNEIKIFNVTVSSALITSLHSNTAYRFSPGFQNQYGIYVFGNTSYYQTDKDEIDYFIELDNFPNCYLDVDTFDLKVVYNCSGGLKFTIVNGEQGSVLFQSPTVNTNYICHQGFIPYLLPLGGNEHTFYIVTNDGFYVMVRSKDYPTRYLLHNGLGFVFEEERYSTFKLILYDFNIEKIDRISRHSVKVTINSSSPILNMSGVSFVIKCKSPKEIHLFNVTGNSAHIVGLLDNTVYEFSAGFQNEYNINVFGNVSFYRTEKYESYAVTEQINIQKGYCLTTIPTLPKEYELSFQFYLTTNNFDEFANIIHFTIGGDCCVYGDRNPILYTRNYDFYICIPFNGDGNYCLKLTYKLLEWMSVIISQFLENGYYIFAIKVDGETVFHLQNNDVRVFKNIKIYTSTPRMVHRPGYIRNITFKTGTSMVSYLIEPYGLPNCFLDVDPLNSKIVYNCNGGLKFILVTGDQGTVLFQSEADNDKYVCHQGFAPYLINLSGDENSFYFENANDDFFFVRSKIYPTRYLWRKDSDFMFEIYKNTTIESIFKFIVNDFNIQEINSVTRYSVNITIDAYISVWNIYKSFVIRCVDPNNSTSLYNFTGSSIIISSLNSYTVYEFSAGFRNEFGFYVFGNKSYYLTDEDLPSAYPVNFAVVPTDFSTLVLSWGSVINSMRNGVIIAYQYSCNSTNDIIMNTVSNSSFNVTVINLKPDTVYNCSIAACTKAGCGLNGFSTAKTPGSVIYLIEPYGLPNCYLDLATGSTEVTYNCNGGLRFFLINGVDGNQGTVSFLFAGNNQTYLCDRNDIIFLEKLTEQVVNLGDCSFYVNCYDSYIMINSSNYPSFVLLRNNTQIMMSSSNALVPESNFKLLVYDLKIIKINSNTSYSVNITIDTYLLNLNISQNLVIKSIDPNNISNLYDFTGSSAYITSLHSYTIYGFHPGLKNEFGFYVFGNVFYYQTNEDVPSAYPDNFTIIPTDFSSLILSWGSVIFSMRNGIIIAYLYSCNITNEIVQNTVNNSTFNVAVTNLKQDTVYNCTVAACTKVGCGVQAYAYNKTGCRLESSIRGYVDRNILNISLELIGSGYDVKLEYFLPPFVSFISENVLQGLVKIRTNPTKYTFPGYFTTKVPIIHNISLLLKKRKCLGGFPIEIPLKLSYNNTMKVTKVITMTYQKSLTCLDDFPKISKDKNALKEYYGRGILVNADKSYLFICMNQHVDSTRPACYYSNTTGNFMTGLDISLGCVLGHHSVTKELYAIHRNQKLYLYFSVIYKRWIGLTKQQFNKISLNLENKNMRNFEADEDQYYDLDGNYWMGNAEGLFYRNNSLSIWTQRVKWNY